MKKQLVSYLKNKNINTVQCLWGEIKTYFQDRKIDQGGGYASWNNFVNVKFRKENGELESFNISIQEVNYTSL